MLLLTATLSFSQAGKPKQSGYAPVNGLKMYYEVYGEGKPLVLLHGSFMTINTNYGHLIPEFAKTRKVIVTEFQGHGRTADTDRPITTENLAEDVAALIKFLKIDSTDVVGYSLGGGVALHLAYRHPQLVRKLVILSSPFKYEGWSAETRAVFPMIKPELFEGSPIKKEYDSLAPDPKHWPVLVNKILKLAQTPYDFTPNVKLIKCPIAVILGDADGVLTSHAAEIYSLIGGGRNGDMQGVPANWLSILPGTSHTGVMMRTDWLLSMIPSFLEAPRQ